MKTKFTRSAGPTRLRKSESKKSKKRVKKSRPNAKKSNKIRRRTKKVELNADCLSEVFGYLDIFDLGNVAATCTNFKYIARDVFSRKFAKDVVTVSNEHNAAFGGHVPSILLLSLFGDLITKLRVDYIINNCFNRKLEEALSKYCGKSAIEIEFQDCNAIAFRQIERPFESVTKVIFRKCELGSLVSNFNKLFPKARCLEFKEISTFAACIEQNFPQIDHLGLGHTFYDVPSDDVPSKCRASLMAIIELNPQIKSLTLTHTNIIVTSEVLFYINEKLPLLDTLNFMIDESISEKRIHFKNLRKLTIVFFKSQHLSIFLITTRLPAEVTLIGWQYGDVGSFLSTNEKKWKKIVLHGLWKNHAAYDEFKQQVTRMKLLKSIEMSAIGLKGNETDVLALLSECKFLKNLKVYSGNGFVAELKVMKADETFPFWKECYLGSVALLAVCYFITFFEYVDTYTDDQTFVEEYRREFERKFKNSAWLANYESKIEEEGDYLWSENSVDYQKQDFDDQ